MSDEPFYRFPEHVTVPFSEIADAISDLEGAVLLLERQSEKAVIAAQVELVIGSMTTWLWPLLRDLDEEGEK